MIKVFFLIQRSQKKKICFAPKDSWRIREVMVEARERRTMFCLSIIQMHYKNKKRGSKVWMKKQLVIKQQRICSFVNVTDVASKR